MPRNRMTHASLFSGIGGGEIAASMMGWENLFHCEIQEFPRRVLEYWYPNSTSYEDITKTDFTPWRGKIDILTGGFPCQPFSCAGKRKGADDDRYLWPEMLRAIREIQPSWVVGENVAGILTMVQPGSESQVGSEASLFGEDNEIWERRQQYVVETVCQDLEREGYSVQPFVIPACAVGAPHRRDRVWFVARRVAADTRGHGGQAEAERGYRKAEKTHEQPEPVFDSGIASHARHAGSESAGRGRLHEADAVGTPAYAEGERLERRTGRGREDGNETVGRDVLVQHRGLGEERTSSYAGIHGHSPRAEDEGTEGGGRGDNEQPQERGEQAERDCGLAGLPRTPSHSERCGRREIYDKVQPRQPDGQGADGIGGERDAADPESAGSEGERGSGSWKEKPDGRSLEDDSALPADRWRDFPTEPPVRSRDDGLSPGVADLSIPWTKWRTESIKALGNAIVPQVLYEIFRAIEMEEKSL